jgi:hypothetical protein
MVTDWVKAREQEVMEDSATLDFENSLLYSKEKESH